MNVKLRLAVMNFLEFAVWGAYLIGVRRLGSLPHVYGKLSGNSRIG